MHVDRPDMGHLVDILAEGVSRAVGSLFQEFHDHEFYYCSLITTGDAAPPGLAAWSRQALAEAMAKELDVQLRQWLKWSYADSPFYPYGEVYLPPARDLLLSWPRPPAGTADAVSECNAKLLAMEEAMSRVERSGVFGAGDRRSRIVVGVEVMPPDFSNVERMRRLNPVEALTDWLAEAAEPCP